MFHLAKNSVFELGRYFWYSIVAVGAASRGHEPFAGDFSACAHDDRCVRILFFLLGSQLHFDTI